MYKAEFFNKTEDGKYVKFPRMKQGETAVYSLVNIRKDPYNKGRFLIPASKNVPATDSINYNGEPVNIAAIQQIHADGRMKLKNIQFVKRQMGRLILNWNSARDQELYGYLELCNFNASNENRNPNARKIFYRVDEEKQAATKVRDMDSRVAILSKVMSMSGEELKSLAISLGSNPNGLTESTAKAIVYDKAEEDPKMLSALISADNYRNEALLREAVHLGVIKNNQKEHTFAWGETNEPIFEYSTGIGTSPYKELTQFLADKSEVISNIKAQVDVAKQG